MKCVDYVYTMFSKKGDNGEVETGDGKNQGRPGFSFKDMMSKASE